MDKLIAKMPEKRVAIKPKCSDLMHLMKARWNVMEELYLQATVHQRHPQENYVSRFFELAIVGDSFIQLAVYAILLAKNPEIDKGEMNITLQKVSSNKFNAAQFDLLCKRLGFTATDVVDSYEIETSKVAISEKIKETCFEALVGAIFLSNDARPWSEILVLYNSFVSFINETNHDNNTNKKKNNRKKK